LAIVAFIQIPLTGLTKSRERSFLSLQICLKQIVTDEINGLHEKDTYKSFNDIILACSGIDEHQWHRATYGDRTSTPEIRYISGNPKIICETKDYPVNIFQSDHLEVCSSDFVVRWANSGKVVTPDVK
jgi:hypothetical protein